MARVSVSSCNPQTSSRIDLRETTRPWLRMRWRSSSASIRVSWMVFPFTRNSSFSKSMVRPSNENASYTASTVESGDGEAIFAGQHYVEYDCVEIRMLAGCGDPQEQIQRAFAITDDGDGVALGFQVKLQTLGQVSLVFDNQDTTHADARTT